MLCLLFIAQGWAYEQADLDKLLETNACIGCDLTYAKLAGANLAGADLESAELGGAYLSGANLSWAKLSMANWIDGRRCAKGSIGECK